MVFDVVVGASGEVLGEFLPLIAVDFVHQEQLVFLLLVPLCFEDVGI